MFGRFLQFLLIAVISAGLLQKGEAAELPVIAALRLNGELVTTNISLDSAATIEWAASPGGPWHRTWSDLREVEVNSNGVLQVSIPAFYRVAVSEPYVSPAPPEVWPDPDWVVANPADLGMDENRLAEARNFALTGGGAGMVVYSGRLVMSWGNPTQLFDVKSTTKSIGIAALGYAISDGHMALNDLAASFHPSFGVPPAENTNSGWLNQITLLHLATHTAGFDKDSGYAPLLFAPGSKWHYSDSGANWLGECLTLLYGDLKVLMDDRVFSVIGIPPAELVWTPSLGRPSSIQGIPNRGLAEGINTSVNAMARIGLLHQRGGRWKDSQVIPSDFVQMIRTNAAQVAGIPVHAPALYPAASSHHGIFWWNNSDGTLTNVPCDTVWSWGEFESLIVIMPSLDLVAVRAGSGWQSGFTADYEVLRGFLEPLAASVAPIEPGPVVRGSNGTLTVSNLPPGSVVTVEWAPANSGPWTNTWRDLKSIPPNPTGTVGTTVPTVYRIRPQPGTGSRTGSQASDSP